MKGLCFFITSLLISGSFAQDWQPTFETGLQLANGEDKPLMIVFAGSDWCAPCIKMDKNIWQSTEFKAYSKDNIILYKADFPRKKANKLSREMEVVNAKLAEKYNPRGYFPLVVLLDAQGNPFAKLGYRKVSPTEFITDLKELLK